MSAEELRPRRGGGERRGAVKAAALRGTLALLTKIPFIPLFIQPPRKVSKEAKMDEKFEPVQLMMHCYSTLFVQNSKLYIPSTINIDLILWHTQLIVCAVK